MIYFGVLASIFLQSTFSTIPLIIPIIVYYFIFSKNVNAFTIAFIAGIFIDIFLLNPIGITSLFLCIILFMVSMYSKKFEIQTLPFIILITFFTTLIYCLLNSSDFVFAKSAVCAIIVSILFYSHKYTSSLVK